MTIEELVEAMTHIGARVMIPLDGAARMSKRLGRARGVSIVTFD